MAVFSYNPVSRKRIGRARLTIPGKPAPSKDGLMLGGMEIGLWQVDLTAGIYAVVPATERGLIPDGPALGRIKHSLPDDEALWKLLNRAEGELLGNCFYVDCVESAGGVITTRASRAIGRQKITYSVDFPVSPGVPGSFYLSLLANDYNVVVEEQSLPGSVGRPYAKIEGPIEGAYFLFAGSEGRPAGFFRKSFLGEDSPSTRLFSLIPPLLRERDKEGFVSKAAEIAGQGRGLSYQGTTKAIINSAGTGQEASPNVLTSCYLLNQSC